MFLDAYHAVFTGNRNGGAPHLQGRQEPKGMLLSSWRIRLSTLKSLNVSYKYASPGAQRRGCVRHFIASSLGILRATDTILPCVVMHGCVLCVAAWPVWRSEQSCSRHGGRRACGCCGAATRGRILASARGERLRCPRTWCTRPLSMRWAGLGWCAPAGQVVLDA